MADNTSNNDTACNTVECLLFSCNIYTFDSVQHRLPCLSHVINLAIVDVMASITKIANVETTTAIWEFDPTLPDNHVLSNSLDVVAAIRTLAIKVCLCSLALSLTYKCIHTDSVLWSAHRVLQDTAKEVWRGPSTLYPSAEQC